MSRDEVERACGEHAQQAHRALDALVASADLAALKEVARRSLNESVRSEAVRQLSALDTSAELPAYLLDLHHQDWSPQVRWTALEALAQVAPTDAVAAVLADLDVVWDADPRRSLAAVLLSPSLSGVAVTRAQMVRLYRALGYGWDEGVSQPIAEFLRSRSTPHEKLTALMDALLETPAIVADTFDYRCATYSLAVEGRQAVDTCAESLVRIGVGTTEERALALVAVLLTGVSGGRGAAAAQIERVVRESQPAPRSPANAKGAARSRQGVDGAASRTQGLKSADVLALRIELGRARALAEARRELSSDFAGPLQILFDKTKADWDAATKAALWAFRLRAAMSVVVFVLGMGLTGVSVWQAIHANGAAEVFGSGVSLAAGVGSMLAVVFKGPLDEIRRAVIDLSDIDIGFMAFMHQLSFTSRLVRSDFDKGQFTRLSVKAAGELLDGAVEDWNSVVRRGSTSNAPNATDGQPIGIA